MIGAIAGDIIGSVYEYHPIKTEAFPLFGEGSSFTDDTVLTAATADALLQGAGFGESYQSWGLRYPERSYGSVFRQWVQSGDLAPYGSWGNGAAMRSGPVGFSAKSLDQALMVAKRSAEATHDHPEGILGAQAVAGSVYLARSGASKDEVRAFLVSRVGYDLGKSLAEIRPRYRFDATARGSVPQALTAFLESTGYEDAVRKAVSLGGDSDTLACIAGAVAEAFYGGVPEAIWNRALGCLTCELGAVVVRFYERFQLPHCWGETRAPLPAPPTRTTTAPSPRNRPRRRDLSPVAAGWS
ncbi:MAG: ADP-ribosylglycohydrolase family protein [Deferrisomatales bacterium]|nr:ADP-ribosylglycohydrolase family protein [Deferrisomatales bacterium]